MIVQKPVGDWQQQTKYFGTPINRRTPATEVQSARSAGERNWYKDGRTGLLSLEIDISSLHRTLLRVGTRANERRLLTLSRSWATTCYHRLSFPMSFSFAAAPRTVPVRDVMPSHVTTWVDCFHFSAITISISCQTASL